MPRVWEIEDSERLLASGRCCLNKRPLYSQYDTSMRRRGSMMSESDTIHSRLSYFERNLGELSWGLFYPKFSRKSHAIPG